MDYQRNFLKYGDLVCHNESNNYDINNCKNIVHNKNKGSSLLSTLEKYYTMPRVFQCQVTIKGLMLICSAPFSWALQFITEFMLGRP